MSLRQRLAALFAIALPIILQSTVGYVMVFTDQAFLGQYRLDSLSSLSNATGPYFMLLSFFMALGAGSTILISQALGANRPRRAARIAEAGFFWHTVVCLGYLVFWLTAAPGLLWLIGARGEILDNAVAYVRILALSFLWTGPATAAAAVFQGQGLTAPLMASALLKSLLNILLDWLLIFGQWGLPQLGVAGAALATTLSDLAGTILLFVLLSRRNSLGLKLTHFFRPHRGYYPQILRIGLPNGLEYSLWAAGFAGFLTTLTNFTVNIYWGLAVAAMTLAGKATGARDPAAAARWGNLATGLSLAVCVAAGSLYLAFPQAILGLVSRDQGFLSLFQSFLWLIVATTFPKAINIVVGAAIRGTGNTKWMLGTQVFGTAFVIGASWGLIFGWQLGLFGLVLTNFLDEAIRAVLNWGKMLGYRQKAIKS